MRKHWIWLLMAPILLATSVWAANPFDTTAVGSFTNRASGYTVTATNWNSDIGGLYTWAKSTLLSASNGLNVLANKGDLYVFTGSALAAQAVGTNGQVLTADSTQTNGIKWASVANVTNLTTKGDILVYGTANDRLPVGTNGQVLTADSTQSLGVKWATGSVPAGTIVAYSPSYGGNSIPSGWYLCDGNNGTPNLIGRFIMGGQLVGGGSSASSGGYGNLTVNANTGTTTVTVPATTDSGFSFSGPTSSPVAASIGHTHSVTSYVPASYVLVYIMKS